MKRFPGRPILAGRAPLLLALALLAAGCARKASPPQTPSESIVTDTPRDDPSAHIATIISERSEQLMSLPGVHGVAEGRTADGTPCILLLVEDTGAKELPKEIDGVPVRLRQSGAIRGLGK